MKNVFSALAVLLMAGNLAVASERFNGGSVQLKAEVIEHRDDVVAVHFSVSEMGTITIRIKNAVSGEEVYLEHEFNQRIGVKRYDLSYLPEGRYIVEVRFEKEVVKKVIDL